jgi:TonB family protein
VAAPTAEGISGTVAVHSRLRTIRVPSELRISGAAQGDGLVMGELLSGNPPEYPQEALRARLEGTVSVRAVIGRDGAIADAQIVTGPALLAAASQTAIRAWRYEPTLLGGQAVEWEEDITLVFRLQSASPLHK